MAPRSGSLTQESGVLRAARSLASSPRRGRHRRGMSSTTASLSPRVPRPATQFVGGSPTAVFERRLERVRVERARAYRRRDVMAAAWVTLVAACILGGIVAAIQLGPEWWWR